MPKESRDGSRPAPSTDSGAATTTGWKPRGSKIRRPLKFVVGAGLVYGAMWPAGVMDILYSGANNLFTQNIPFWAVASFATLTYVSTSYLIQRKAEAWLSENEREKRSHYTQELRTFFHEFVNSLQRWPQDALDIIIRRTQSAAENLATKLGSREEINKKMTSECPNVSRILKKAPLHNAHQEQGRRGILRKRREEIGKNMLRLNSGSKNL